MATKFQPFKSCGCGWCRGSRRIVSRRSSAYRDEKRRSHRKFRRTGHGIGMDYEMPGFVSGERWY
jgi:hypothetical protein